ncbi:hypothetical protein Ciccas_010969 [Cichlidogyrus casuarinus]|uniref:Uncharacterized protein n=1 Tax=Cichlidogyrus casuarinus TaxID=1844966 RepID=A0ABD2PSL3_9PLAT
MDEIDQEIKRLTRVLKQKEERTITNAIIRFSRIGFKLLNNHTNYKAKKEHHKLSEQLLEDIKDLNFSINSGEVIDLPSASDQDDQSLSSPLSTWRVIKLCMDIRSKKQKDDYGLSIEYLLNLPWNFFEELALGSIPEQLLTIRVFPIAKKHPATKTSDFGLISVIPSITKIIE